MTCTNNRFCAARGILLGGFIFIAMTFGISYFGKSESARELQYETPVYKADASLRAQKSSIVTINLDLDDPNPLVYLFQILFWLFLISPPIIVVLLLVIISKMKKANKD